MALKRASLVEPWVAPVPRRVAGDGGRARSRLLALLAPLLALVLAGQLATALPASAHDYLVSTSPAVDGTSDTAPAQVTLTFNEAVNTRFSTVQVTGPAGGVWQNGSPQVLGATVTQRLLPLGPAGPYRVTWRVVSADGHPVGGTFDFTLRTAGTGTPAAVAPNGSAAPAGGQGSSGSWLPLAGGLVLVALLLAGAAAVLARRGGRAVAEPTGEPLRGTSRGASGRDG